MKLSNDVAFLDTFGGLMMPDLWGCVIIGSHQIGGAQRSNKEVDNACHVIGMY